MVFKEWKRWGCLAPIGALVAMMWPISLRHVPCQTALYLAQGAKGPPQLDVPSADGVVTHMVVLSSRRSLCAALQAAHLSKADARLFAKAIPGRLVRAGQKIDITRRAGILESITIPMDFARSLKVKRTPWGRVVATRIQHPVQTRFVRVEGYMQKDMLRSVVRKGVSQGVALDLFRALTRAQIHWRSFVKQGSRFAIFFQEKENLKTGAKAFDKMCFVKFKSGAHESVFYCYRVPGTGVARMYTSRGELCGSQGAQAFCKPLARGKLTSCFGVRLHPIYRVFKMHQGIDYAAPRGTPVVAAAHGRIDFVGYKGGLGKSVAIRHDGGYQTVYAHLDRHTSGLRRGQCVSQGKVIGYVGSTGHATGPHLHFELRCGRAAINPLAKLGKGTAMATRLKGRHQASFQNYMRTILDAYARCRSS